jgi:putative Mg2+ transporter-C (MgtC) family protein
MLGSAIGFERQWHQKMAGLRTNALVALGSCGFVVFSAMVGPGDPTRVAAQVVTGIGFLGAGIILREGINVHGLNTAFGSRAWLLPASSSELTFACVPS